MKTPGIDIKDRITEAFAEYRSTISLVEELIDRKANIYEVILLVSARLDSLANATCQEKTQRGNFFKFVSVYSNDRDLITAVSVPDLHNYFARLLLLLPGMVEKPGRLHFFDPMKDSAFLAFLWKSELPITQEHIEALLRFVIRNIRKAYRAVPGQPRKKKQMQRLPRLHSELLDAASSYKTQKYVKAIEAMGPILNDHMVGNLLYTDYRCAVIHDYSFEVDPALFFKEKAPYYAIFYNKYVEDRRFMLHFPAPFLLSLLRACLDNYEAKILRSLKLPSTIWYKLCDAIEESEYLDDSTLEEGRDARLTI